MLNDEELKQAEEVFKTYDNEELSVLIVTLSKLGLDCVDTIKCLKTRLNMQ